MQFFLRIRTAKKEGNDDLRGRHDLANEGLMNGQEQVLHAIQRKKGGAVGPLQKRKTFGSFCWGCRVAKSRVGGRGEATKRKGQINGEKERGES